MKKWTLLSYVSFFYLAILTNPSSGYANESMDLYIKANQSVGNEIQLTPE